MLIPKRTEVTTESWDLPCPVPALPQYLSTRVVTDLADTALDSNPPTMAQIKAWIRTWSPPRHFTDLLTAKYYNAQRAGGATAATAMANVPGLVTANANNLFPPELLAGLRMNLNRPFFGPGVPLYSNASGGTYPGDVLL